MNDSGMKLNLKDLEADGVLSDCERSLDLLEQVPEGDRQLFRIYWTYCLVCLRRMDDVLAEIDSLRFPLLGAQYKCRQKELDALKDLNKELPYEQCDRDYLIYWRFIRNERNKSAHKEGPTSFETWTVIGEGLNFDLGDVYLPFSNIVMMGDHDCRDWLRDAIDWWREELRKMIIAAGAQDSGMK